MKPPSRRVPMFECDFKCYCGRILGLRIALAVVQSEAGAMLPCTCGINFKVTEAGAEPIREKPVATKMVAHSLSTEDIGRVVPPWAMRMAVGVKLAKGR